MAEVQRASLGNMGDAKSIGGSVCELHIDYGPGTMIQAIASISLDAGLYRALNADGNPSFDTTPEVTKALGLRVTICKAA